MLGVRRPEIAGAAGPSAEGQQAVASVCRQPADAVNAVRRAAPAARATAACAWRTPQILPRTTRCGTELTDARLYSKL